MRTTYVLTFCACRASRGYYICRTPRPVRAVLPREDTISASVAVSFFFCARPLPHATLSMFPCSPRTQEPQWPCAERPRLRAPDRHIGTGAGGGVCVAVDPTLPQTPWSWVSGPPSRWRSLLARARWETHSSILRVWFSFPTRLCAMPHISDPERIFFPPKSRWCNFFPAPSLRPPPPALFDRLEVVWRGAAARCPVIR